MWVNFECEKKNYLMKPSLEMVKNGFTEERNHLFYFLSQDEIQSKQWFKDTIKHMKVISLFDKKI